MSATKEHYHNKIEAGIRSSKLEAQSPKLIKEHPILFSTPMVKAILEGRKTQTRRIIKPQPNTKFGYFGWKVPEYTHVAFGNLLRIESMHRNPYGQPGDLLWVRESFKYIDEEKTKVDYKTQYTYPEYHKWKPSIHMPKAAARIWLEITEVKVDRLMDITNEDAVNEGIVRIGTTRFKNYLKDLNKDYFLSPLPSFRSLWESINGEQSFMANPWVWVVKFRVVSTTGKPNNK